MNVPRNGMKSYRKAKFTCSPTVLLRSQIRSILPLRTITVSFLIATLKLRKQLMMLKFNHKVSHLLQLRKSTNLSSNALLTYAV